jgi:hypothetical protein
MDAFGADVRCSPEIAYALPLGKVLVAAVQAHDGVGCGGAHSRRAPIPETAVDAAVWFSTGDGFN